MKKVYYILSLVTLLFVVGCSSDLDETEVKGGIAGTVSDATTGEPVPTVKVTLSPGGKSTVTGTDGSFSFINLDPDIYSVSLTKEGYTKATSTLNVKAGNATPAHLLIERLPASITADKSVLEFGDRVQTLSFTIVNRSYTDLKYSIEKGTCDWLSIKPENGTLKYGKTETIVVNLLRDKLPMGRNEAMVVVRSLSGDGNVEIKVIAVNGNAIASLNTLETSDITSTTAMLNGEIVNIGEPKYTERGFVYSTNPSPSVNDCIQKLSCPVNDNLSFSCKIEKLATLSTYYVRAYLVQNGSVIYGNTVSFSTSQQPTTLSTSAVTGIEATKATLNGKILNVGKPAMTEKGFCYSTTNTEPTIADTKKIVGGTTEGDYSLTVTDLSFPKQYYVRAYAIQSGSAVYGNTVSFSTSSTAVNVLTAEATNISSDKATLNGSITNAGSPAYTERGFCFSSSASSSPTVNDKKYVVSGTGTGDFSVQLSNLVYNQRYSFRAYAMQNGKPVYGETKYFSTSFTQASVVTMDATSVAYTSAIFNGSVTNAGDPVITERGFCYAETYSNFTMSPNIGDRRVKVSGIAGSFKAEVKDLQEDHTYYVRAYAIQNGEPIYGEVKKVTTGYAPIVVTGPASNVKSSSSIYWQATFVGRFADGDPEVTDAGFVYGNTINPTVTTGNIIKPTSMKELSTRDTYEFSRVVTNLSAGKTYYYRAFVKTSLGYTYGDSESFTTY